MTHALPCGVCRRGWCIGDIDRAMGFDIVHGVSVQLNETWLALWQLSRSLTANEWKALDNDLNDTYDWLRHMFPMPRPRYSILDLDFLRLLHSLKRSRHSTVSVDPKWSCKSWDYISKRRARKGDAPFVINVLVTPPEALLNPLMSSPTLWEMVVKRFALRLARFHELMRIASGAFVLYRAVSVAAPTWATMHRSVAS